MGALRPPTSGRAASSQLLTAPPAQVFDADAASSLYEDSWNYRSTETKDDLAPQQAEQLPHTYATAPKLVLRPLAPTVGALDAQCMYTNSDQLHEKQMLHASGDLRMYRQTGATHQYAGVSPDPDTDWASDQVHGHPAVGITANPGRRIATRVPPGGTTPVMVLSHHVYDLMPYMDAEQQQQQHPPTLPLSCDRGAGGAELFHQQQAAAMVGATMQQQHAGGPRRAQYGQRVLLQRLMPPPDGDVSYLQGLPYVDTYTADCQEDSNPHAIERLPQDRRNHPHHYHPYGAFQDPVQRGQFVVHRAAPRIAPFATTGGITARDDVMLAARGAAAELAAAIVRRDELYGWPRNAPEADVEGEIETGSETRGALPGAVKKEPSAAAAAAVTAAAAARGETKAAKAAAAKVPAAVKAEVDQSGGRQGASELWNLEALAEVACRAAELLEREEDVVPPVDAEAAEAGSMSLGSGGPGHSRGASREVGEERSRGGGGGRRRGPAAAAGPRKQQRQQQAAAAAVPEQRPVGVPAAAGPAAAPAPGPSGPSGPSGPGGRGSSSSPVVSLPLTVFHTDRKCPKVLAPRSGRLGDTKHLVLPAEIVQALPGDVSLGGRSIWVQALMPATTAFNENNDNNDSDPTAMKPPSRRPQQLQGRRLERYDIECQIGNGPGGFAALHLPVSQAVYGRPVRRFTLREDLVLELELGDPVASPSRGSGGGDGKRTAEAAANGDAADAAAEGVPAVATAAAAADVGFATSAGSPREVCTSPAVGKRKYGWELAAAPGQEESRDVLQMYCTPDGSGKEAAGTAACTAVGTATGPGSGSNLSDDTKVVGGAVASPPAPAAATTAVALEGEAAADGDGGGGGRRRGAAAAALPILVRRPASGKPTVMRSCTGAVGSKKHLPLPANIVKALPPPQRNGVAPVDVVIAYLTAAGGAAAAPEERLSCFVGQTGSHGCTALQVPVSRTMNGRRLLHISLRLDMAVELGLGDVVDAAAAAQGRRRATAAAAASAHPSAAADDEDDDDDDATGAADGAASAAAAAATMQWAAAGAAAAAAAAAARAHGDDAAPRKRRRSSSISPSDSTAAEAAAVVAAAVAAAAAAPPPLPPAAPAAAAAPFGIGPDLQLHGEGSTASGSSGSGNGNGGDGLMDANLRRGYKEFVALVERAGYVMGRVNPPPPPHQQQREVVAAPPPPPQRQRPQHEPPLTAMYGRPRYQPRSPPPMGPPMYGMLPYAQAMAAASGRPPGYSAAAEAARRSAPVPPPRGRPMLDQYGRPVRQPYYHCAAPLVEDADVSSSGGGGGGGGLQVDHHRLEERASAAAALGRSWGLLQQLPRAQLAAARALAVAAPHGGGGAGQEAAAALGNFRACLAGILGLLMRAREAAVADLAVQLDAGGGGAAATDALRADLLAAAPAMLNAAECLLEWYNLLATATDESTAVSYATELAGSAALVKAQLAHELAPLAVLVRV